MPTKKTLTLLSLFVLLSLINALMTHLVFQAHMNWDSPLDEEFEVIHSIDCGRFGFQTILHWAFRFFYIISVPGLLLGWLAGWRHWIFVIFGTFCPPLAAHLWMHLASGGHGTYVFCYEMVWQDTAYTIAILVFGLVTALMLIGVIGRFALLFKQSFWFVQPPKNSKNHRRYLVGIYISHIPFLFMIVAPIILILGAHV